MIKMSLNVSEDNLGIRRRRFVTFLKKVLKMDADAFTEDEIDLILEKIGQIRKSSKTTDGHSGEV